MILFNGLEVYTIRHVDESSSKILSVPSLPSRHTTEINGLSPSVDADKLIMSDERDCC